MGNLDFYYQTMNRTKVLQKTLQLIKFFFTIECKYWEWIMNNYNDKTKPQLIEELESQKKRIEELEQSEFKYKGRTST